MESFFQRLYKYRESKVKNAKENYLTEILSQCLILDPLFREKFLALIHVMGAKQFNCQTQYGDNEYGKPDLHIWINGNVEIIIECKIEAKQSPNQLNRYADLLKKGNSEIKYLVYLTKYYEPTDEYADIIFTHIRWFQVFKTLIGSINQLSIEFSEYLKEEKMSTVVSFNRSELNAIKSFSETMGKMNDVLARIKDVLRSRTTNPIRQDKTIQQGSFGIMCELKTGYLWIGFYQYENHDEIQICVSIEAKTTDNGFQELHRHLNLVNFDYYDNEDGLRTWYIGHNLSDFFRNETFNVEDAIGFIEERLHILERWF